MKRLLIGSCMAVMCAAGVGAQAPTGTSKPQTPPASPGGTPSTAAQQPSSSADSTVLRGCLKAGETAGTYILTNASATSGGTMKNATVQLAGSPAGTDLKSHVGHTVEITGMMAAGESRSTGTGTTGAGTGAATGTGAGTGAGAGTSTSKPAAGAASGSAAGASAGTAKLTVKSMKHVKEGC